MSFEFEATYENGVLKPAEPLPLKEHQRVTIAIKESASRARRSFGLIGWTGDAGVVRRIAVDDEFGAQDAP